jgi:hypothetical protein
MHNHLKSRSPRRGTLETGATLDIEVVPLMVAAKPLGQALAKKGIYVVDTAGGTRPAPFNTP